MQFQKVRDFYVTDCDGAMFRMNAFRDLGQLENLYIEKVKRVEFESGVFQSLTRLSLQNIQELKFGERAFMGAHDLKNIEMRRVNITQLHSHSLFDIRELHSLELDEVDIRHVERDAVKIDFNNSESHVLINSCTVSTQLLQILVFKLFFISIFSPFVLIYTLLAFSWIHNADLKIKHAKMQRKLSLFQ
jgi:hypothetical protein